MASPASSSLPDPVPSPAPTVVMKTFMRACGCFQSMIYTPGDAAQAARYEATACVGCREPVITFDRGWGRRSS